MKSSAIQTISYFFTSKEDYNNSKRNEYDVRIKEDKMMLTGLRIKLKKWIE